MSGRQVRNIAIGLFAAGLLSCVLLLFGPFPLPRYRLSGYPVGGDLVQIGVRPGRHAFFDRDASQRPDAKAYFAQRGITADRFTGELWSGNEMVTVVDGLVTDSMIYSVKGNVLGAPKGKKLSGVLQKGTWKVSRVNGAEPLSVVTDADIRGFSGTVYLQNEKGILNRTYDVELTVEHGVIVKAIEAEHYNELRSHFF